MSGIDTWSEEWRHRCEVKTIAEWDLKQRREYLELVKQKRGEAAAQRLKEGLTELWKQRKGGKV
ncbi:hypothetical protein QZM92_26295 [Burkholderia multivorans]|nr:hypothetical protein [Burkholderia multivorans]